MRNVNRPTAERGMTLTGLLVGAVVVGGAALLAMTLYPLYYESFKVRAALEKVSSMPDIGGKGAHEIRTLMMRNFEVSDVDRFTDANLKNHLKVTRSTDGKGRVITMSYEDRAPLIGNLDVILKFDESIPIAGLAIE
jgi:hypothetical protein